MIMAARAKRSQIFMLKTCEPNLSTCKRLTRAKRLMVLVAEIGTVFTKVVKLKPRPKVKLITEVLGKKACA